MFKRAAAFECAAVERAADCDNTQAHCPFSDAPADLREWANRQRIKFHAGNMSASQIERLETIPGWVWDHRAAVWDDAFTRLVDYTSLFGSPPAQRYQVEGFPLGCWVKDQRRAFHVGNMSASRVERLETIPGWVWDHRAAVWDEALTHLLAYRTQHGHTDVPLRWVSHANGDDLVRTTNLGRWVQTQRRQYAAGTILPHRKEVLNGLAGWTWRRIPDM